MQKLKYTRILATILSMVLVVNLFSINFGQNADASAVIDGVTYADEGKTLREYPKDKTEEVFCVPESVTRIAGTAFQGNDYLKEIYIPENTTIIEMPAFEGCDSLEKIEVDEKNEKYQTLDGVLYDENMQIGFYYPVNRQGEYSIPDSVTTFGTYYKLENAKSLTKLTLGAGVTEFAFLQGKGFHNLKELYISAEAADSISEVVFKSMAEAGFEQLEKISVEEASEKYTSYQNAIYSKDYKNLYFLARANKEIQIHKETEKINNISSYQKENLFEAITVEEGCESFVAQDGVLYDGKRTEIILFPSEKTTYEIPKSVNNVDVLLNSTVVLDDDDFEDVLVGPDGQKMEPGYASSTGAGTSLKEITVANGNAQFSAKDGVLYNKKKTKLLLYPAKKTGSLVVPASVKVIDGGSFVYASKLTRLVIPGSVLEVKLALHDCISLKEIVFKEGVLNVAIDMRKDDAKSLKMIKTPASIARMHGNCFGEDVVVKGYTDTEAKTFAKNNILTFKKLGKTAFKVVDVTKKGNKYSWKKVKNADGYQVFIVKNGMIKEKKILKGIKKNSFISKSSYGNGVFYVRPYKVKKGKKVYGKSGCFDYLRE